MQRQDLESFRIILNEFNSISVNRRIVGLLWKLVVQNKAISVIVMLLASVYAASIAAIHFTWYDKWPVKIALVVIVFMCGIVVSVLSSTLHKNIYDDEQLFDVDSALGCPWFHIKVKELGEIIKRNKISRDDVCKLILISDMKLSFSMANNPLSSLSVSIGMNFLFVCVGTVLAYWSKVPFRYNDVLVTLTDAFVFEVFFILFAIFTMILPPFLEFRKSKQKKMIEFKNALLLSEYESKNVITKPNRP